MLLEEFASLATSITQGNCISLPRESYHDHNYLKFPTIIVQSQNIASYTFQPQITVLLSPNSPCFGTHQSSSHRVLAATCTYRLVLFACSHS